jgi:hypothetical protein
MTSKVQTVAMSLPGYPAGGGHGLLVAGAAVLVAVALYVVTFLRRRK